MSSNPVVLNPVEVNPELKKAIESALDPADIKAAILAEAQKQTNEAQTAAAAQVTAEKEAVEKKAADEKVAAEKVVASKAAPFSRTETIGGKEFTFEADSEIELERAVSNAFKVAYSVREPEHKEEVVATPDPAVVAAAAQKEAEDKAALKADLELKWKRGEISAADYIDQSGAMDEYLAKKGVPLEALKAAVDKNQTEQFTNSWAQATEEFLHSPAGGDWPGGERNKIQIGMQLAAMNLTDTDNKVEALTKAYAEMKAKNMVFPSDVDTATKTETETAAADAAAKTQAEATALKAQADAAAVAEAAAKAKKAPTSSSLFGVGSGTSGGTGGTVSEKTDADKVEIPKDATPAEILDVWKKEQIRLGKNPNDAFKETFASRRV